MIIDKKEAKIVRLIYRLFLEGRSPYFISNYLQEQGIPSPMGIHWSQSSIRSILQNEKYCGDAILQKSFVVDMFQKKIKKNEGELPQT